MADTFNYENKLVADGWSRRFIACEPKLSEALELYKESGFEVLLVNLPSQKPSGNFSKKMENEGCSECFDGVEEKYRIIYTKPER